MLNTTARFFFGEEVWEDRVFGGYRISGYCWGDYSNREWVSYTHWYIFPSLDGEGILAGYDAISERWTVVTVPDMGIPVNWNPKGKAAQRAVSDKGWEHYATNITDNEGHLLTPDEVVGVCVAYLAAASQTARQATRKNRAVVEIKALLIREDLGNTSRHTSNSHLGRDAGLGFEELDSETPFARGYSDGTSVPIRVLVAGSDSVVVEPKLTNRKTGSSLIMTADQFFSALEGKVLRLRKGSYEPVPHRPDGSMGRRALEALGIKV